MPRKKKMRKKPEVKKSVSESSEVKKTLSKGKILWANSYCLMDTSSGASISVRQMLNQLLLAGYEVEIVGATIFDSPNGIERISKVWERIQEADAPVINIEDGRLLHRLVKTAQTERNDMSLEEANRLFYTYVTRLDEFDPDVIFYYGGSPLEFLMTAEARVRGIPTMAYLVNANYQGVRWCRDVDRILTDSYATSNMYLEKQGFKPLPIGKFIDPANIIAKKHERQNLTFINPSFAKGAGIVAQVAYILEKKRPDIKIEIVQSRGDWDEVLKAVTKEFFGEERTRLDNIILTPNTPNMDKVYERSRVVFAPSLWWESGSRVLAEAMINGIPALVSNRGGNAEMIGEGGLVFDLPENLYEAPYAKLPARSVIEKLVQVIETFWDDEDQYLFFVSKALLKGATEHSMQTSTNKLIKIIDDLMETTEKVARDEALKAKHKHSLIDERFYFGLENQPKKTFTQPKKTFTRDNKNLAMVTPYFWPQQNGMEMAFDKLATEFVNQGYSVDMYAPVHDSPFEELDSNYQIFRIKDGIDFVQMLKKRNELKSYDYILCQSADVGATIALMAQKEINIPVILRTHGIDVQKDPENQYGWRLDSEREKIILNNINSVNGCVISAQLTEEFKIIAPNTPRQVIHSGINPKRFFQEKNKFLHTQLQLDPDIRIILMVGRNIKKKNFHLGLEAFKYLQKYEKKTFLVHIGTQDDGIAPDDIGKNLNEYAKTLNVENSFASLGRINHFDIPKYYNSAEILIVPSQTEVFGNVTLEAMACGLVPVEFDYGANRDKIKNGANGFIIPFGDTISMGKILRSLLKSPKRLKSIQTAAVEYSKKEFSISKTVHEYEKLFSLAKKNFLSK